MRKIRSIKYLDFLLLTKKSRQSFCTPSKWGNGIVGTPPLLKGGGGQLSKIGNLGGDKINLSKKGGQIKKVGVGLYWGEGGRGGSVFLLVFWR